MDAFDLAERLQTLVFVMSDLDLGMNNWMSNAFEYPDKPLDRGKVLDKETLGRIGEWGRYKDVDGDGIPYRTIPGTGMPPYFTRGSGHNEKGQYSERPDDYVTTWIGSAGSSRPRARWCRARGRRRQRRGGRHHRLRQQPLGDRESRAISSRGRAAFAPAICACAPIRSPRSSAAFIDSYQRVYVVEQNRDAQMLGLMRLELARDEIAKLRSVRHYSGLPIDARSVTDEILVQEGLPDAGRSATPAALTAGK